MIGKRFLTNFEGTLLVTAILASPLYAVAAAQSSLRAELYFQQAVEATDWIASFQVTPPEYSWGIPFHDERTWGMDPFYYDNGTITGGLAGIQAGERQRLAFLIGGHDSGLGASAALDAYVHTGKERYMEIFRIYFEHFLRAQVPSPKVSTNSIVVENVRGRNTTLYHGGFWAEQANVASGQDGKYGTSDDQVRLFAAFPAAEHGNPIAQALIYYYRLTGDQRALAMLNRYGTWLLRTQIQDGEFAGAYPVTQYYWAFGWKPRMFETTESAWILAELYLVTGNRTYLEAAVKTGRYMLSKQFTVKSWNDTKVDGALPYEWNGASYTPVVLTNHAGFTLLAWTQLYRTTGNRTFLDAALRYANWLLSFQVTPRELAWGDHAYANDTMAVGGYYYGYNPRTHTFGARRALSLWSASYSTKGLLFLTQVTENQTYARSAQLAADWLTRMRFDDRFPVPLQALATIKYVWSSWWGPYPQFYQPDSSEVKSAGIPDFVNRGLKDSARIRNPNPSWFERTFDVDFNLINFQMASRGDRYMKMLWSWWPDIGFEPRYGGDIAFGLFAMANYASHAERLAVSRTLLERLAALTGNNTAAFPNNITQPWTDALKAHSQAMSEFNDGWYGVAAQRIMDTQANAQKALEELRQFIPLAQLARTQQILTIIVGALAVALVVTNVYWKCRFRKLVS